MTGMAIRAPGFDGGLNRSGFVPRVGRGAKYFFFGRNDTSPGENLIEGESDGTITGQVGSNTAGTAAEQENIRIFRPQTEFVDTGLPQTGELTVIAVAYQASANTLTTFTPIISNNGTTWSGAGTTNGFTFGINHSSANLRIVTDYDNAGTPTAQQVNASNAIPRDQAFLCAARISTADLTAKLWDEHNGETINAALTGAPIVGDDTLRIGGTYNAAQTEVNQLAFVALYDVGLTDAEVETQMASIRAHYAVRGITLT